MINLIQAIEVSKTRTARREFISGAVMVFSCGLLLGSYVPFVRTLRTLYRSGIGVGGDQLMITVFLLNLALLLFAWRRYRDLLHLERAQEAANKHADVTGLPNMITFEQSVRRQIEDSAFGNGGEIIMLALDVDRHEVVADIHGPETAETLLREIGNALVDIMPAGAIVAHAGTDEFAVAFTCPSLDRQQIVALVRQMTQKIDWIFSINDKHLHATCSIGAATTLGETLDYPELRRRALMAMHFSMRRGHGHCAWFGSDMDMELRSRSAVEDAIRAGIPANEFQPFFEQQIDLATGRVVGFEVLARWQHDTFGSIPVERIIDIAEKTGLIAELSKSVIRTALLEARNWDPGITLSVNISPIQMQDPWLAEKLLQLLVETGFPASRLEVEVTESALVEDFELARTILTNLKNQGIRLALDDFGTGYSSLQHLRSLPFDRLKIDKSFVQTIDESPKAYAIAGSIAALADNLGLPVTAEGVETPAIMERLIELGCEKGQGWHFGRPMPAAEARKLARRPLRVVAGIDARKPARLAG